MSNLALWVEEMTMKKSLELTALDIIDDFLKKADSIVSREAKNEMIEAMRIFLPQSEYANREIDD